MNVPARGGVKRASKESAGAMMGDTRAALPLKPAHAVEVALELDAVPVNRRSAPAVLFTTVMLTGTSRVRTIGGPIRCRESAARSASPSCTTKS